MASDYISARPTTGFGSGLRDPATTPIEPAVMRVDAMVDWLTVLMVVAFVLPIDGTVLYYVWQTRRYLGSGTLGESLGKLMPSVIPGLVDGLSSWARTDSGKAAIGGLLDDLSARVIEDFTAQFQRRSAAVVGGAQKSFQALDLFALVKTGNPMVDGVIAMLPPEVKRKIGGLFFRAFQERAQAAVNSYAEAATTTE